MQSLKSSVWEKCTPYFVVLEDALLIMDLIAVIFVTPNRQEVQEWHLWLGPVSPSIWRNSCVVFAFWLVSLYWVWFMLRELIMVASTYPTVYSTTKDERSWNEHSSSHGITQGQHNMGKVFSLGSGLMRLHVGFCCIIYKTIIHWNKHSIVFVKTTNKWHGMIQCYRFAITKFILNLSLHWSMAHFDILRSNLKQDRSVLYRASVIFPSHCSRNNSDKR